MFHKHLWPVILLAATVAQAAAPDPAAVYAWYNDASLQVLADGYSLGSWSNRGTAATNATLTAAGRDLSRLVGAPQKLWLRKPDGSATAAVSLSGGQALWAAQGSFGALTGDRTLVACLRVQDSTRQGFLFDSSSYTLGLTRAQVNAGNWQVSVYGSGANSSAAAPGLVTAPALTNVWQTHAFVVKTGAADQTLTHYIDGTPGTVTPLSLTGALGGLILGMNASAQVGIRADIAEVLVFDSALDSQARTNVEAYLQTKWSGVIEDPNAPPRPGADFVRVFTGGVDGYTCFRIPALVTTTNGTLIAVSDGRIGSCGDIPTPLDLVCKRSFDNGKTWGPLQVIAGYGTDPTDVDTYPFYSLTNISRVSSGDAALLLDRVTGRVWTLYDNGGVKSDARKIKLELRYSDDDGATWSEAIDLEARNPGIRPSYGEFLTGPGNGIQLTEGSHAGRLIFPVYIYGSPSDSMCIYSDDGGNTWRRSASCGVGGGEVQMAETPGGGLIASMRDNGFPTTGVRTFNRSSDGGATWGAPYTSTAQQPAIPDPACQGNIYRLSTTNDSNAARMVHVNAASASARVNLVIRMSYNDGATWPISNQVYAAGSAYSSVTKLATGDLGVLFEKDPYGNLDYVRRSVSQISGGTDSLPPYTVWAAGMFTPAQLMQPSISAPNADPDQDGLTNQEEFEHGSIPTDPASPVRLSIDAGAAAGNALSFLARSNTLYTVQVTSNVNLGQWEVYTTLSQPAAGAVKLPFAPTNDARFFRVMTQKP